jgi:hypothetical protein
LPECDLALPSWRLAVLVVIEVVILVVIGAGYPPEIAVATAAGGGLAAAKVATRLLGCPSGATRRAR